MSKKSIYLSINPINSGHLGDSTLQSVGLIKLVLLAIALTLGASTAMAQATVYNAVPNTLAPSYASLGFQANQTAEFGDYIHLAGTNRVLNTVTVTMVAWAPNSDYPLMGPGPWSHNFTVNIYNVAAGSPLNTKGSLIATATQLKSVPWRPAADPTCPGGTAWRAGDGACYNGYAFDLSFDMSSLNSILPNDIIIGLAYSTQTYGAPPMGVAGPYNSLNVAALGSPALVGSDANADRVFWNTSTAGNYTDGGAGGVGIFREDTVWGPANGTIPFKVTATPGPVIINAGLSSPFVNPNAWLIYNDETDTVDNSLGSLVVGPGTAPLGNGSAQISVSGTQRRNLATYQFSGIVLSDITTLKFSTYNPSAGNGGSANRSGYLHFNVDFNGSDTFQQRIGFVTSQNGSVIQNQWQEWDAINGGSAMWFYSGSTWPGTATPGTTLRTWSDILSSYPGVRIRVTDSFFGIRVGEPYTNGYTENIDAIKFGTSTSLKYFNFDPLSPVTYVDGAWAGMQPGADPDGAGPATSFGYDAFDTVQGGVNGVAVGGTVNVASGNYSEEVNVNKANVSVHGAGIDSSYITGPYNLGTSNTLLMNADGVLVEGFTITRSGNNTANWTSNIKNQGVSMSAPGNGMTLQYCKVTGNRNGIYVGQSSNSNTIRRNIVDFNRTGIHLVDHRDDLIEENFITNNWTMGILYRTEGGPAPTGLTIRNNRITGNWYSEVEFRDPSTGSNLNMSGNYFGSSITRTTTPSGEPGYTGQIPVEFGGSASAPGSHPTIAGVESARIDYSPYLNAGTDTAPATTGFQGDVSSVSVTLDGADTSGSRIQEGISLVLAGGSLSLASGMYPGNVNVNKAINLRGFFTVSGSLTVSATGSSISPGNSPGIINSGNLLLGAGTTTNMELNGTTVGTQYDQLNVTGTVTISSSAALNVTLGFVPATGNAFTIINNDGADAVTGTFNGLPEGTVFYIGASSFRISYVGGSGNDVVLTVVALCNAVSIENETGQTGGTVDVDISTDNTTGHGLKSTDFVVTFNPAVVTFNAFALGSVTAGRSVNIFSPSAGVLNVSIFGATDFTGSGTLGVMTFNKVGLPGTSTPVSFSSFKFNEGTACLSTVAGSVTITGGTISGTVTYGNSLSPGPATRNVPNVLVNAVGSPTVSNTTGGAGTYLLSGFGAGSYTVTPSKSGGVNGAITSFDAAKIAQHVVGGGALNATQQIVADVSGFGGISSFDASLIARYVASLGPPIGSTGAWLFNPANQVHPTVYTSISGEDYSALLMGDVSGNWGDPSPFRPAFGGGPERPASVTAPRLTAAADSEVIVPVMIQAGRNKGVISYEFDLRYDPLVIQPQDDPVDLTGTVSNRLLAVANAEQPGLLRVVVYGPTQIDANGVMLNLRFVAVGAAGSVSPLSWERLVLNEGSPRNTTVDGQVELSAKTSNQAELGGKLLTAMGQGVSNVRVTLTDTAGQTRSSFSNGFGLYRFGGLEIGQTYTVSVASGRWSFTPLTVSVTDQVVNVDMIAQQ